MSADSPDLAGVVRLSPRLTSLACADWTAVVVDDHLTEIRYQGRLIADAVRGVVRDEHWSTATMTVREVRVRAGASPGSDAGGPAATGTGIGAERQPALVVAVASRATLGGIDCRCDLTAHFQPGQLTVDFTAVSPTAFSTNRIGLVVLHPSAEAGQPVQVRHPDGSVQVARFPDRISPHQPFRDIVGMAASRGGLEIGWTFTGETFENEDQRNWTDDSFKTYSRPLSLPFPFSVGAGEQVRQRIRITVRGSAAPPPTAAGTTAVPGTLPAIGTSLTARTLSALSTTLPALSKPSGSPQPAGSGSAAGWSPSPLLFELDTRSPYWPATLAAAQRLARERSARLDLRVVAGTADALDHVMAAVDPAGLTRLGAYAPDTHLTELDLWAALAAHRADLPGVELVAGARSHFTELNRASQRLRSVWDAADGISFSITPQMHAPDLRYVISSLNAQRQVALDGVRIAAGKPVHIGPITLRRRFNAVATTAAGALISDDDQHDALQDLPFAAAWMLASVTALSVPGVASLSYYCLADLERAPMLADIGGAGAAAAAAHCKAVLERLASLAGAPLRPVPTVPAGCWALEIDGRRWLANLTPDPVIDVDPGGIGGDGAASRTVAPFTVAGLAATVLTVNSP